MPGSALLHVLLLQASSYFPILLEYLPQPLADGVISRACLVCFFASSAPLFLWHALRIINGCMHAWQMYSGVVGDNLYPLDMDMTHAPVRMVVALPHGSIGIHSTHPASLAGVAAES